MAPKRESTTTPLFFFFFFLGETQQRPFRLGAITSLMGLYWNWKYYQSQGFQFPILQSTQFPFNVIMDLNIIVHLLMILKINIYIYILIIMKINSPPILSSLWKANRWPN